MQLWETNLIAVYWTLKRAEWNFWAMVRAKWEFVKEAYVEFEAVCWRWFPTAKFKKWTNKFLKVELFNVPLEWVTGPLDSLEWYPSFYTRKGISTIEWDTVIIYEIVRSIQDNSDDFLTKEEDWKKYYTWK